MSDQLDNELDRQLETADDIIGHAIEGSAIAGTHEDANELKAEKIALQASLEDSIVKHSLLTRQYEDLQTKCRDAELEFTTALLDKELQLTQLEADLTTLQLNQEQLRDASKEADALKETIQTLTEWHADLTAKLTVCEQELAIKTRLAESAKETIGGMHSRLEEVKNLCDLLENSNAMSDQLVELFTAVEDKLSKDNKRLKQETQELRDALNQGLASLIVEKDQLTQQYMATLETKSQLEKRLREVEPQLIPRWDRLNQERKESGRPSAGSYKLSLSLLEMENMATKAAVKALLNAQTTLTNDCRLPVAISPMLDRFIIHLSMIRTFLVQTAVLMRHLVSHHIKEWLEMANDNVMSLKKDRGHIQWVFQALKDCADVVYWLFEICQFVKRSEIPGDQLFELDLAVEGSPGKGTIQFYMENCRSCVDVILSAFLTDRMSTALTTQPLAAFSKKLAAFLYSKGYKEDMLNQKWIPITLTNRYASRLIAAVLCSLASVDRLTGMHSVLVETAKKMQIAFEKFDQDVFDMDIQNQHLIFSVKIEHCKNAPENFTPLSLLIALCATVEIVGDVVDPSETWSATQFSSIREIASAVAGAKLNDEFIASLCQNYETWEYYQNGRQASEAQLVSVELHRWVLKQLEQTIELKRSETLKRQSLQAHQVSQILDALDTSAQAAEEDEEKKRMKERLALMEMEIERLRKQEREFQDAEEKEYKLIIEMKEMNRRRDHAERTALSLKAQVGELTQRCQIQDETIKQMMVARRAQEMAPPSVASFELLKIKASMYKLQDLVTEMATNAAERDWALTKKLLNLADVPAKTFNWSQSDEYKTMMKLRESLIELGSRNIGLEGLKSLVAGQKVNSQELFRRHQDHRRRLLVLKDKLEIVASPTVVKG